MAKKHYPNYHKTLLEQASYPEATRRIKFVETTGSLVYKTGTLVYKVPKSGPMTNSLALKEVFLRETVTLYKRWAPPLECEVVPIVRVGEPAGEQFALGDSIPGTVVDYALKTKQLADPHWVSALLTHDKFNATAAGKVAKFLATQHLAQLEAPVARDEGRPEHFRDLLDELLYQSKKYIDLMITQPMLDLVLHLIQRFLEDEHKLLLRRQKKGFVLETHGAFVPEHLYLKGSEVLAVSPLVGTHKFRTLDAANDPACFVNALLLASQDEMADLFIKRYASAAKDRDVAHLLPLYQTLQALRGGLLHSERQATPRLDDATRQIEVELAKSYYTLAVRVSRVIGKT